MRTYPELEGIMPDLIIGMGEVGNGLYTCLKAKGKVMVRDVEPVGGIRDVMCLHICIPYSEKFVEVVNGYIDEYKPVLTIVHSTVPVGTTRKVKGRVVHSPIRGRHPNLAEEMRVYVKYIGYNDDESLKLACECFEGVFWYKALQKTETTELGKLLELARYGLTIAFAKDSMKMCDSLGVSYSDTVLDFIKTYNEGIEDVGGAELKMTSLRPSPGPIGGHCIIPNCIELHKQFPSQLLEGIIAYGV